MHVPAAVGHGDKPHARLHQPAGEEHPHPGLIAAVLVLDRVRFLRHVEGVAGLVGADHAVGTVVEGVERVERVALFLLAEVLVHDVEHPPPLVESGDVDAARQAQVLDLKIAVGRVAPEAEAGVRGAEIARPGELIGLIGDADVRGKIVAGAELVGHHRSHARVLQRRARPVAGEHVVGAALVGRLTVGHRAADGEFVGNLGGMGKKFAHPNTRHIRLDASQRPAVFDRGKRLGIERLLMGHATGKEDADHRLRRTLVAGVVLDVAPRLLHAEEIAEGKAEAPDNANREKPAPGEFVTSALHGCRLLLTAIPRTKRNSDTHFRRCRAPIPSLDGISSTGWPVTRPPACRCKSFAHNDLKAIGTSAAGAIVPMEIEWHSRGILTASPDYRSAGRSRITFRQWVTVASERVDASPTVTRRQRSASSTTPV